MLIKRLVIINDVLNEVAHGSIAATIGSDEVGDVENLMTCIGWAPYQSALIHAHDIKNVIANVSNVFLVAVMFFHDCL